MDSMLIKELWEDSEEEFSEEAGVWGSAPPSLPSPAPARSGPPAYTGFPITEALPIY